MDSLLSYVENFNNIMLNTGRISRLFVQENDDGDQVGLYLAREEQIAYNTYQCQLYHGDPYGAILIIKALQMTLNFELGLGY